ncbi:T9SS-dependent M36 family metallopeptidase [Flavobacterium laiguense]|uniref:Peptidase M36 n=1 Tax=Flavobacterium laiguense TaxID=2169409 RepID=A0A2U1JYD6_9FLAO|nr:T9SS-dependent M36 family metallopeptidase [Flavobacterium laiguense]PWA10236.1 peptidase M36 [Flavobacterium laiguense]
MKKITLLFFYLIPLLAFSQSNKEIIQKHLNSNTAKSGLSASDVNDWIIESEGTTSNSAITNCYVLQRYNGIEIFRSVSNFSIKNGQVVNADKKFVANVSKKASAKNPSLSVTEALKKAYEQLKISPTTSFAILETISKYKFVISNGLEKGEPVSANLVYFTTKEKTLVLAWDFTINTNAPEHKWSVRVDAQTGKILEKKDCIISCNFDKKKQISVVAADVLVDASPLTYKQLYSKRIAVVNEGTYNVIPFNYESPNHTARKLISNAANSTASPFGWHDTNGVLGSEYTITRGNNVWAQDDMDGDNDTAGTSPDGGASLVFDFPYLGANVAASNSLNAANTNLFYMNNVMHDVWYQYGFDEANGNFQKNNYGKGGAGNDFVHADAQDGSAASPQKMNNANFSSGNDGRNARMQMFLWNYSPPIKPLIVTSPSSIAGSYVVKQNGFNPGRVDLPVAPSFLQSDLVLYVNATNPADEGCFSPANGAALNGKMVILRRGGCNFSVKVKFAQDAGAIAVIVVNNKAGEITMSGADATITIPAISVSQEVGESLIAQMQTQAVNVKLQLESNPFVNSDGDFDNGIIAHEYGHGISTRLAGGRNNSSCLDNTDQMGEGWSDWIALMMQLKPGDVGTARRGIGTYVSSEPTDGLGIRDYPYSTDKGINPMTYANTNKYQYKDEEGVEQTEEHGTGAVWATVLWDLSWAYINKYSYDDNKYNGKGGNNKVMQVVLDGIKLQPCSPTFVSGRDAIIAADQAITGGQNFCMIWEVFAARGLGKNASAGDANVGNDQVEDFTMPSCVLAVKDFENEEVMKLYPNPSSGIVNIRVSQYIGKVSIQINDITGRVVYTLKDADFESEKTLDLSSLAKGVYILTMKGEGLNYVEKVIID